MEADPRRFSTDMIGASLSSSPSFQSLGLPARALSAVARLGWSTPSPIQQRAIPPALEGRDVIGCAATGTGKTGAFLLPMLERLKAGGGAQALILAPTRELAQQIDEQLKELAAGGPLRSALVIGGLGMNPQADALRQGREVIVATPGRLIDHLDRGAAKLAHISLLVLDEADRMLDMGFKPQLEKILRKLPAKRQTLLFSATMAGEVAEFAKRHVRDPVRVEVERSGSVAERAGQRVFEVKQDEKAALLVALLADDDKSTLVFTRTKHRADKLARVLERAGHSAARIHANRSQSQRRSALEGFRAGEHRVLVATDIASRGIDVEDIGHVVNFDLPQVPEDYVHRVGRTARAGASGVASSFCTPEDRSMLREIERFTRFPIPRAVVPRESEAFQSELTRVQERQVHPGPKQRGHGVSNRPAGQPPGRHARTHRRGGGGGRGGGGSTRPRSSS
jgi:ATP-dependent RNA helicase RhlE